MAVRYPPQGYDIFEQPQWPIVSKPAYSDDDGSSVLDEKALDPTTPADHAATTDYRHASMIKVEDEYVGAEAMWQDRPHSVMGLPGRHYSHPSVPLSTNTHQAYPRIDPRYAAPYSQPQTWQMSASSGASTPTQTPVYGHMPYAFGANQSMPQQGGPVTFASMQHSHDPSAPVAMSPQSSQGGWASTTSSDSTEPRSRNIRSPTCRAASPMTVMRPDGIRKKNARFEIPKERNLQNIDSMIMASKDETEKKELKQQKRLLRNRQAALDSRQRKKTHTEKLEQEKKLFTQQKQELEETLQHAHENLRREQEQWMQQRQQYQHYIQNLEYERDEAIRTKTLETAELRRMNNILKDHIRDLERQYATRQYPADNFTPDFSSFDNLGIEDNWDDEFSLIGHDDLKMDTSDAIAQQSTPKPPPSSSKSTDPKSEVGFSWNTFYMCLLFGAFIAANTSNSSNMSSTTSIHTSIPPLSEDYRAEAGNVLKAVLSADPESAHSLAPTRSAFPITTSSSSHLSINGANLHGSSNLENLHAALTTPSRHQAAVAAFSLSAASYNHITNPDPSSYLNLDGGVDAIADPDDDQIKPTRLQSAFASMQEQRADVERVLRGNAAERSLLWERVPEKVLRDFREMVACVNAGAG